MTTIQFNHSSALTGKQFNKGLQILEAVQPGTKLKVTKKGSLKVLGHSWHERLNYQFHRKSINKKVSQKIHILLGGIKIDEDEDTDPIQELFFQHLAHSGP